MYLLFLLLRVHLVNHVLRILDFGTQEWFENSLLELLGSENSSVRSRNTSLSIGQSSHSFVSNLFQSWDLWLSLDHWLDSFLSLLNVLDDQSASRSSDLSDFVWLSVVGLSSHEVHSVGCHCFIIYIKFKDKLKVKNFNE